MKVARAALGREAEPDATARARARITAALAHEAWSEAGLGPRLRVADAHAFGRVFQVVDAQGEPFLLGCLGPAARFAEAELEVRRRMEADGTIGAAVLFADDPDPGLASSSLAAVRAAPRALRWHHGERRLLPASRLEPWTQPAASAPLLLRDGAAARALRPLSLDGRVEEVLFATHSHMRDLDGLHAPEALDELCKLLFLKIYDERATAPGAPYRLQAAAYGSADELASVARRLYRRALSEEETRLGLAAGALSRVWGTLTLSDAALTRCLDELGPHSLGSTSLDVKGRAFQSVLRPVVRAGMGQYFTPERVGRMMIEILAPTAAERTLDPFAGSAHFLALAARRWREAGGAASDAGRRALFGIEKSERMMRVAWTDLMLHEIGGVELACADALGALGAASPFPDHALGSFDVVVTNPPFGSVLRSDAVARLGAYETAAGRATTPVEELALERAARFLRPAGRLAIVLPDGVLGNRRALPTRRWAAEALAVRAIVSLPVETFLPFGANVKASIVFARRLAPGERQAEARAVFLARLDDVGHDAAGRATSGAEVEQVTAALCAFLRAEGW